MQKISSISIIINLILLIGICSYLPMLTVTSGAKISIGTVIDTVGMVDDRFTGTWYTADGINSSNNVLYRDYSMTNGGAFKENKFLSAVSDGNGSTIEQQKVVSYNGSGSGSHMIGGETIMQSRQNPQSLQSSSGCVFFEPTSEDGFSAGDSAMLMMIHGKELTFSSISRIAPPGMYYSVSAGGLGDDNKTPMDGTISTIFTDTKRSGFSVTKIRDRSLISGKIDLYSRTYQTGEQTDIIAETKGEIAVNEKTVIDQKTAYSNPINPLKMTGTIGYESNLLTSGGRSEVTREAILNEELSIDRILRYFGSGMSGMQTSEDVIATLSGSGDKTPPGGASCVLSQNTGTGSVGSDTLEASADFGIMGAPSAETDTQLRIIPGSDDGHLSLSYSADITSPIGFNQEDVVGMKDLNKDGRYEDLNGNGKSDMQDIVFLFQNLNKFEQANLTAMVDFNGNGRSDYSDLIYLFKIIRDNNN